MTGQKEFKIVAETPNISASTTYWELDLTINDKKVFVSRYISYDDNLGVTDENFEILDDSDGLTEEEEEAVKEYCMEKVEW